MNIFRDKTITDVPGILAAGISCGIKKGKKKDLCVIFSKYKAHSAAVFTTNNMKAAPLIVSMENIKNANTQAIVVNSGNANSCTGQEGVANAKKMVDTAAKYLGLSSKEVLVASTGALAAPLPMDLIVPGIKNACSLLSDGAGQNAAEAILTTDTCTKTIAVQFEIQGITVTMAGMAKGSTMIHPNMGTLLAFIVTDANVSKELLHKSLRQSVDASFNMVSIDGDTSTNDIAILLANGASNHIEITSEDTNYQVFSEALKLLCTELAKMIAEDGEGSTKFIEVEVVNAATLSDARKAAKAIISSNLIKCEMFGSATKWSTIACVLGYSGADMNPEDFDITLSNSEHNIQIVNGARETKYDKHIINKILSGQSIKIQVDLKIGKNNSSAWGCDLSPKFVKANAN